LVNARNKGRRGEREVIDEIKELLGIQLEVNYSQTFGGGHDLLGLDGFAIEVKRRKVITPGDLKNFWEQTTTQARKVRLLPCLWFRADRSDWRVMIAKPYALKNNLFEMEDFNVAMNISTELFASLIREEYGLVTRDIVTQ